MRPASPVLDEGLQPERTLLAWRRTAVALAVGALVGARVLEPSLGVLALVAGLAGLVVALAVGLAGRRRFLRLARVLDAGGEPLSPGGALPAWTCVAVLAAALAGGVYVLVRAAG